MYNTALIKHIRITRHAIYTITRVYISQVKYAATSYATTVPPPWHHPAINAQRSCSMLIHDNVVSPSNTLGMSFFVSIAFSTMI